MGLLNKLRKSNSNPKPGIKQPDHYRTTVANNAFGYINSSSSDHSISFTASDVNKHKLLDCQVGFLWCSVYNLCGKISDTDIQPRQNPQC